jgi:glutaconate CoA-transferase subunit A
MLMTLAEPLDFQTAVVHCGGDESYHWYYQRGRVTHEVVSAAQIDRTQHNNIEVISPTAGGCAYRVRVAWPTWRTCTPFLLISPATPALASSSGSTTSAPRVGSSPPKNDWQAGYQPGEVKLVTNMGVFELDPEARELALVTIPSRNTVEEVQEATGFPLRLSPSLTETPSRRWRSVIDSARGRPSRDAPAGVRRGQGARSAAGGADR